MKATTGPEGVRSLTQSLAYVTMVKRRALTYSNTHECHYGVAKFRVTCSKMFV